MILFMGVYFAVYGGLNFYLAWRVRQGLRLGLPGTLVLAGAVTLLVLGPILAHSLERTGSAAARPVALVSHLWMAAVLWGASLWLLRDLWNGAARLASLAWPEAGRLAVAPGPALAAITLAVVAAAAWGWHEARSIRLERVTVLTDRLPPGASPVTVAQVSDLHVGPVTREGQLRRVAALVREARPDLLVSTGDLVDAGATRFDHLCDILAPLDPPLGKYAVTGNHEFYAGLEASLEFTRACGFRVLRGESVEVAPGVLVGGVDDPGRDHGGGNRAGSGLERLFPPGSPAFRLLLKHRPEVGQPPPGSFDLQLSGHTHKGQIFPFGYLSRLANGYLAGWFDLGSGSSLYVSRGTGTWGPPLRLLAPPEVTLLTVRPRG